MLVFFLPTTHPKEKLTPESGDLEEYLNSLILSGIEIRIPDLYLFKLLHNNVKNHLNRQVCVKGQADLLAKTSQNKVQI